METNTFNKATFNLDLLKVQEKTLASLGGKVTSPQIFDNTNSFHHEGLFSTVIFGAVGASVRTTTFGYIDLGITVMHPFVYHIVTKLKAFYKQIAEGKVYAIFNKKTGMFEKSNEESASTGFNFLMSHLPELKFEETGSEQRSFYIKLFEKARKEDKLTMRYLLVMPAALRDYTVDPSGKPQEDEINGYYRKIISQTSLIVPHTVQKSPDVYDSIAASVQNVVLELFNYIKSLLDGKHKLILGKWLTRKIFNSTRNVLTAYVERSTDIDDPNRLKYNETMVGLHQFARALVPKSLYEIKNKYIRDIFVENSNTVYLTNVKTLKREEIVSSHVQKDYDLWTSSEGLMKVIASLGNLDLRNQPILLNNGKHYMGLVYRDRNVFKFFQDIDELPPGFDKENVSPVTLYEFIYMNIYHLSGKYPGFVTRYPIIGYGSIYPSYAKVLTTNNSFTVTELDSEWNKTDNVAHCFPDKTSDFVNTLIVHPSHLAALDGDYDGDTGSFTVVTTDEAVAEVEKAVGRKEYYFSNNQFVFSNDLDTLDVILGNLTA